MQHSTLLAVFAVLHRSAATKSNPVAKTLELFTNLQQTITRDGEDEQKAYEEFFAWCDDSTHQKEYEIKTATKQKDKLEAAIAEANSDIEDSNTQITQLAAEISSEEGKLKTATELREREKEEFESSERELMSSVDMLNRAIGVLEKESEQGTSFVQGAANTKTLEEVMLGLSAVVDAASFIGDDDKEKLMSLIQSREDADDAADDSQPATAAYEGHSGGIVEVMEDMRDKAEAQLRKERSEEAKAVHNFEMTETALRASIADGNTDLETEKTNLAQSNEAKATAEGELAVTKESLAEAQKMYSEMQHDCMQKASDHEITLTGRKEELAVLAKAKKIIQASIGGAEEQTYGFLQVSSKATARSTARLQSRVQLQGGEVVKLVEKVATEQRSTSLEKLASKIKALVRFGAANGEDPFVKIKQLVQDMIRKLEREADEEATEKAYCDSEMGKTEEKKGELQDETEGLKARIDEMASQSALLKEQVKDLQEDLLHLAENQKGMDEARTATKEAYEAAVADLNKGLTGIRSAIKILRDYFASDDEDSSAAGASLEQTDASFSAFMQQPAAPEKHEKSSGAGSSIIGLLEVVESDLAKNLAEENTEESAAVTAYESETMDNKVSKATKEQDIKLKTKEFKGLDKSISDSEGDLDTASTELSAVLEYYDKLKERCIAKPETYQEAKRRREAEIKGLEEALAILEGETASFLQRRRK